LKLETHKIDLRSRSRSRSHKMKIKKLFSLLSRNDQASSSKASTVTRTSASSNSPFPESILHFISDPGDDTSSINVDGRVIPPSHQVASHTHPKSRNELDENLSDDESARVLVPSQPTTDSASASASASAKAGVEDRADTPSVSASAQTSLGGVEVHTQIFCRLASDACLFSISLPKHMTQKDLTSPAEKDIVDSLKRHIQLVMTSTNSPLDSHSPTPTQVTAAEKMKIQDLTLAKETSEALIQESDFSHTLELCTGLLQTKKILHAAERADILSKISLLSLVQGDTKSSMKHGKNALKINREESRLAEVAANLVVMGLLNFGKREFYDALRRWREALQLTCLVYGYDHPYNATLLNNLGCLHYHEGDLGTSLKTFTESHDLNREFLSSSSGNTTVILLNIASTKSNIAMLAARCGDLDWAVNVLEEVLSVQSSIISDRDHFITETTKYTIDRLMERREIPNSDGSSKLKLPLLCTTSVASRTHGASDAAAIQSCSTFQPVHFKQSTPSIFGDSDGIPMRRLGAKSVVDAIDDTDILDFLMFGPLLREYTPTQRVRATVLNWFGKTLQDDQNGKLTCVPFNGTPRKRISIPVDVDQDAVIDAEFYLKGISEQAIDHLEHDETEEALELFRSVLSSHIEKYGNFHHLVGTANHNLGLVHMYAQDYAQAVTSFQEAVATRGAALGDEHPAVAASLAFIGMIYLVQRDPERALETFTRVLKLVRRAFGHQHIQAARSLNNIAVAQYEHGIYGDAFRTMEEADGILRQLLRTSLSKIGTPFNQRKTIELAISNTLCNLGFLYCRQQKYKASFTAYHEAGIVQRKHAGFRFSDVGCVDDNMRYVRAMIGDIERKEQLEKVEIENADNCLFDSAIEDFKSLLRC
jgi:tetratricopeptide (TPR) repeat protein